MKKSTKYTYLVYFRAPLISGDSHDIFVGENGTFTTQEERAKRFNVNNLITLLIMILQLFTKFQHNYKYKKV